MKLLLAEDEQSLSRALMTILTRNGYTVDAACDGQEALDYMETGSYDAVILDIMMPRVDGITVLQTIREKGILVPVLLLTAKAELDDKILGLDTGANDYLTKPFNSKELLARIRAMTRVQNFRSSTKLQLGNVTLDRATFEISTPAGGFRLANKEFQMLEMMMRNPKSLISSERFLEKVWGKESDVDISIVWIYITYLRKKLAALHADIQIRETEESGYGVERILATAENVPDEAAENE